eukprot:354227-Chlamydomonas_euryale.AAC.4
MTQAMPASAEGVRDGEAAGAHQPKRRRFSGLPPMNASLNLPDVEEVTCGPGDLAPDLGPDAIPDLQNAATSVELLQRQLDAVDALYSIYKVSRSWCGARRGVACKSYVAHGSDLDMTPDTCIPACMQGGALRGLGGDAPAAWRVYRAGQGCAEGGTGWQQQR